MAHVLSILIQICEIIGCKLASLIFQVSSIKCGMWDSIYDTFQAIAQNELTKTFDKDPKYESISVEPSLKNPATVAEHVAEHPHSE